MKISFWGSSLVSAYWNGAATYYRGILRGLAALGNEIAFYEPDAYDRQKHRDIPDPEWAHVIVYDPQDRRALLNHFAEATKSEIVVKASGVGVLDEYLEDWVSSLPEHVTKVFWDVDAPATLDNLSRDGSLKFHRQLPFFDFVLTYGGGNRVVEKYKEFGARECIPIYNAFDPEVHFPVEPVRQFAYDLSFLGNRLPDREVRVEEFFFKAARISDDKRFLLGGSGWADKALPDNMDYVGHVYTSDHNTFNSSPRFVLNIARDSMASYGYSPATRVFEAAGAAACLISDAWEGLDHFLTPGVEILVAEDGESVARLIEEVTPERAYNIGQAARRRVLSSHTYGQRASLVNMIFRDYLDGPGSRQRAVPCAQA